MKIVHNSRLVEFFTWINSVVSCECATRALTTSDKTLYTVVCAVVELPLKPWFVALSQKACVLSLVIAHLVHLTFKLLICIIHRQKETQTHTRWWVLMTFKTIKHSIRKTENTVYQTGSNITKARLKIVEYSHN